MHLNCGVGEDSLHPLDCKEFKPVHPKGNQSWIFIGRTDAEAKVPILQPPDAKWVGDGQGSLHAVFHVVTKSRTWRVTDKNQLIRKDPNAGKDWRKEEKRMTENKMVAWYQWLNAHEFEQALGSGGGQVSLAWSMGLQSLTWLSDWTATNPWRFLEPHRYLY